MPHEHAEMKAQAGLAARNAVAGTPDGPLLRAFLLNVAEAIDGTLAPELGGSARNRAGECVGILRRAALGLEADAAAPVPAGAGQTWDAVQAEGAALDRLERRVRDASAPDAAPAPSRSFDRERFERYLQQHAMGGPSLRLTECRLLAGGRSKQTVLLGLQGATGLPEQCVVRQDWASAVTGTSVVSEFSLLQQLHGAGLRVPQPLLLERSAAVMGGAFLLVTRMPGGPRGDIFNPAPASPMALQLAAQLARLHRLPVETFSELGVPTEAVTLPQLRSGLQGFAATCRQLGTPSHTIEGAIAWLESRIEQVRPALALVHNDLGCHNFLLEGDDLAAILDWELAHIGNPAADLGYVRDWVCKIIPWARFMAAYREAGGPAVDPLTLDFYTLWCGVRLYCLLLQARAGVAAGLVRDTEITFAVAEFLPMLLHRISRELRAVLDAPA